MATNIEIEPGAALESALVTTDSYENFEQMSSSLEEIKNSNFIPSTTTDEFLDNCNNLDNDIHLNCSITSTNSKDEEYLQDEEWLSKPKHVFVLSSAGKPIYSRFGNEDRFASYFGIMQALVSFVQADDDSIRSIHAGDTKFVFLFKEPLILVAVSKTGECTLQLTAQLNYVFNQIASTLTLSRLVKIYEQRRNYDLRRLLTGVDRFIDHLLDFSENEPAFTLGAVQCLPLSSSIRDTISAAIIQSCSKIKNVVFGILLAKNQLITLVRMKKYYIHPHDLHLIFNLVQASESFKTVESCWAPICLPRFDSSGFLYGHVSYLAEDCQACLILLTVEGDAFSSLSEAKQRVVERLRRGSCLEAINESLSSREETCMEVGFPEVRHYLYKSKSTAQFYQPHISAPYSSNHKRLMNIYKRAHYKLHCPTRPLKLLFERTPQDAILAWDTRGFELYAVLEPLIETSSAISTVGRLLNWIKKREDKLFHLNAPTF
ncbi:hypothetical protein PPYR_00448 [Photinus pyralis]|uniref:Vacuolar fusion protein MON1 homolog n=1 Tax=Photinus pyralis TaxID=7054 RepID=A0A1Y1LXA3_PHOPY|nr:vacuolar fusion protein MON1 homolog A [Photinus pyralis]KAB0803478.1 hypothetical protein PPYR_00448 [Photinus pyralis]